MRLQNTPEPLDRRGCSAGSRVLTTEDAKSCKNIQNFTFAFWTIRLGFLHQPRESSGIAAMEDEVPCVTRHRTREAYGVRRIPALWLYFNILAEGNTLKRAGIRRAPYASRVSRRIAH